MSAEKWIKELNLEAHPEGGYYCEYFRSDSKILKEGLPPEFSGDRSFLTSIYFLLKGNQVSKFHRICGDEMWYFLDGTSLLIHVFTPEGKYEKLKLGRSPETSYSFQQPVLAGSWFGAEVEDKNSFALVACAVGPGFDFSDFEMAEKKTVNPVISGLFRTR